MSIEIFQYQKVNRGPIVSSFSVRVPKWGGFEIRKCKECLFNSKRTFLFPSQDYENSEGKKKHFPLNAFGDPKILAAFEQQVFQALDKLNACNAVDHEQGELF